VVQRQSCSTLCNVQSLIFSGFPTAIRDYPCVPTEVDSLVGAVSSSGLIEACSCVEDYFIREVAIYGVRIRSYSVPQCREVIDNIALIFLNISS
jgi:hypothetical protein